MNYFIDKIIVVEGKEDISYLSSFIDAEYVSLNGYDMPEEEIDYLNEASKFKEILVLVDPDVAGRHIEEKLKTKLLKATYLHVDISKCSRGKKDGVAECEKEELINVLKPHFSHKSEKITPLLMGDLSNVDLLDNNFKRYLSEKFHLGKCNLKKLFVRLNTLGISAFEIEKAYEEYHGNQPL